MDVLSGLAHGFSVALQLNNLGWCFLGCFLGTVVGILPGLGPAATIAMLIPLTLKMDPASGIIMLAGIYYGAKYGGSTTSILLNIPGESSSVATCIDGYQMARKGRAGAALGIAAIASFIAGTFGVVALSLMAPPVAAFALSFNSQEYFALMVLGLALVVLLSGESLLKGLLALLVGLWLASIGTDLFSAQARFIFGQSELLGGLDFTVVAIGVFAIAEVMASIEDGEESQILPVPKGILNLLPNWQELKACRFAFFNGSVVGFILGVLPGAGATIASFVSYGLEKAVSRHPEKFGTGVPEGVAAPEGANNADTGGALVPLLTLGIPNGASTAIMLSALVLWGVRPGPMMIQESPTVFWGLVASMYIGNAMLIILNLPLVPLFAQILRLPVHMLFPLIFGVSMVGVYAATGNVFNLGLLSLFGLLGFVMRKLKFPATPLLLGFVLGDSMEQALRQSLMMSQGDPLTFVERPMSAIMLALAVIILISPLLGRLNRARLRAITENG
ncbi:MAG TPA: tripartite tricarboxylate transporter permease [Xanthobacteraceae bacterium]|jgi:putative tricarboxylic transport membrane protein|nr:tripartite tricarboxylate transporter permease [Xanthobacteraceae bacterium]